MDKYKEIRIEEIILNGVKAEYNGQVDFYHKNSFLDYKNLTEGDRVLLGFNKKNGYYNQLALVFDIQYLKNNFKKGEIYQGVIINKISNFYILKIAGDKFIRIYESELLKDKDYELYDVINVSLNKRNKFSMYQANLNLFREVNNNEKGSYPFRIKDVEKSWNDKGYLFYTENGLKIFAFAKDQFFLDKNHNFFKDIIFSGEELILEFYYSGTKFKFSIEDNLELYSEDGKLAELEYNDLNNFFYLQTDKGYCELDTNQLNYLEKNILKNLLGSQIIYNTILITKYNNKSGREIKRARTVLHKYEKKMIYNLLGKEFENAEIIDVVDTTIDKRVYILDLGAGLRGFLEAVDYSYDNSIAQIGDQIEKLEVKDVLGGYFIFLSRKPYLIDPREEFFSNKKVGEIVVGRVKRIYKEFIVVTFNNSFDISILKENLLPLKFFEINKFYQSGEVYNFYITQKKPKVQLRGYDLNEFKKKMRQFKNQLQGTEYDGKVYKRMVTKYIIRIDKYIEAELPIDEISYLKDDNINFSENDNKEYKFRILNVYYKPDINSADKYKIVLSRKRMSNITYAFKREYEVGSRVKGNLFYRNQEGFYFNLEHNGKGVATLTAFLSNDQIASYPNLDEFHKYAINNKVDFKITSYPRNFETLSESDKKRPLLNDKAIEVSKLAMADFNIKDYYKGLYNRDLYLKLEEMLEEPLKYRNQPDRVYFERRVAENKVIFAISKYNFIPGLEIEGEFVEFFTSYLAEILSYYNQKKASLSVSEQKLIELLLGENNLGKDSLESMLLLNLKKDYFNSYNNTIEVNHAKYIARNILEEFSDVSLEVLENQAGEKFCYLFNNDTLRIKLDILNENIITGKEYKFKIFDYVPEKNSLLAKATAITKDSIGELYPAKVLRKMAKKRYKIEYLGENYGILDNKNSQELIKDEVVYARLEAINEDELKFSYDFDLSENKIQLERLNYYSINDLISIVQNVEQLTNFEQQDIFNLYRELNSKTELINLDVEINFEEINSLLESGFMRESYLLSKEIFNMGNFGRIYKGIDLASNQKIIAKRYTSNRENDFERERFKLEAKTLLELDIPGVINAFKYYPEKNEYIAEFIPGQTLREYVEDNKDREYAWKKKKYLSILKRISEIMDELHLDDIVHCDLKPENIIYNRRDDKVSIIDFGSIQKGQTKGGFGTIFYASPEQCRIYSNPDLHYGDEHDFKTRDDIYSFGVMMYEIFAGCKPYDNKLEEKVLILAHQFGQRYRNAEYSFKLPSYHNPKVEQELEDIILTAMAEDREDRYFDFYELKEELEEI